jgi:hypothetical protein
MIPITQLLARFKNISNTEELMKFILIQINHSQISFSKNTIFLKVQPIIKTEITLHKAEILEKIKTIPGLSGVNDIQ